MTDRDFEKYIEGDSPLSRAYRAGATDNPPASIDRAVRDALAAEHAATAAGRSRLHEWHRFLVPMAAAATVLLSFSLVMQLVLDPTGEGMRMDDSIAMSGRAVRKAASAEEFAAADAPTDTLDALDNSVAQAERERPTVSATPAPSSDTPAAESAGDARVVEDAFAATPPPRVEAETIPTDPAGAEAIAQPIATEPSGEAYAPEPPVLAARDEPGAGTDTANQAESDAAFAQETREAMAKTESEARDRAGSEGDVIGDALDAGDSAVVASNRGDVNAIDDERLRAETAAAELNEAPSVGGLAMESASAPGVEGAGSSMKPQLTAREKVCRFERDERLVRARSVESRIEVARNLVELACMNQARDVIRELADDEPGFDISDYPDLAELMEDEY